MSFFIKNKRKNGLKPPQPTKKKQKQDDEITSESESDESTPDHDDNDSDQETAQEKRVKLAKIYLDEIQKLENKDDDEITEQLKHDYLSETGKLRSYVADLYETVDETSVNVIRNKWHKLSVTCLCVSSDNKYAFSGSKDGGLVKWCLIDGKKLIHIALAKKKIVCLAISENAKFLAVGDGSNDVLIYNPESLQFVHCFRGHRSPITGLVFRRNSPLHLYSSSKDKAVKSWSLDEKSYLETLFGHQDAITSIDALSKERCVTSGGCDATLRIWKIPEESQLIFNGSGNIDCVKLLNEDNFISGSDTGELSVWSALKKKPLCSVKNAHGPDHWITSLAAYVNTDLIASGSNDGYIRLWKLSNSYRKIEPLFQIPVQGFVNCLTFTNDGKQLIAGVGQEHRNGRWFTNKAAKNGVLFISLIKHVK